MAEKEWWWYLYYNASTEKLERKIQKHGCDTLDHRKESLFMLMLEMPFSIEKIDLVFKYKPTFYKYHRSNKIYYIEFEFDFAFYFGSARFLAKEKKLYIFLKILQSMELHLIRDIEISCQTMPIKIPHLFNRFDKNPMYLEKKIFTKSIMGLLEYCYIRDKTEISLYIYYHYIFHNEIVRKTSLSEIVFKKINQF